MVQKVAQKDDGYIRFLCASCSLRLKIKVHQAGGVVISCPNCGSSVVTPMSAADIEAEGTGSKLEETLAQSLQPETPESRFHVASARTSAEAEAAPKLPGLSKHQGRWTADESLPHVTALDDLHKAIEKIEKHVLNKLQDIYRDESMDELTREDKTTKLATRRHDKLIALFKDTMKRARIRLMADESNSDDIREQHTRALEAVQVFARLFYGVKV